METEGQLSRLFKGKSSLDSIGRVELMREENRLKQVEARLSRQVGNLEKQKQALFAKGVVGADHDRLVKLAARIKELNAQVRGIDNTVSIITKQLRVIHAFVKIKEAGIRLGDIDLVTLLDYVYRSFNGGELRLNRLVEVLSTGPEFVCEYPPPVPKGDPEILGGSPDEDKVMEIERAMQEARAAWLEQSIVQMKKPDSVLHPEKADTSS